MKKKAYSLGSLAAAILLISCDGGDNTSNVVTGEGYPNPNPIIENEWGDLPADRQWGSREGIDLSLIHISEPTISYAISYSVF